MNKTRALGRVAGFPRLLGGALCLDFVNTVEGRLGQAPIDALQAGGDLARWSVHVGVLDGDVALDAHVRMPARPEESGAELVRARAVREDAYALLSAIASGRAVPQSATAGVQRAVRSASGRASLQPSGAGFAWTPCPGRHLVVDTVALDLLALLTSDALQRVRQCPGCGDCGWLFLDTSPNGRRQWCSMEGCGSRAKMRRQYQRSRDAHRG